MSSLPDSLIERLTFCVTPKSLDKTFVVVRPGMALSMYYSQPLHVMGSAAEQLTEAYLNFIPEGIITSLCGRDYWGPFSRRSLSSKLRKLKDKSVNYTNIDLGSGPLLASEGPYGFHINGGNLANIEVRPFDTNVFNFEFPPDELDRSGTRGLVDWAVNIAELHPFETGQFGYSFNQLQRTWTTEADAFIGNVAMDFHGFDILEPSLARAARKHVPNCSWINFFGDNLIAELGGESAIRATVTSSVVVRRISGGLLVIAGEQPALGEVATGRKDLGPILEVARLTQQLRVKKRTLTYGSELFRKDWIYRLDSGTKPDR